MILNQMNLKMLGLSVFSLVIVNCSLMGAPYGADSKSEHYIDNYSPIAISEMQRTGIPASIKLAQGLLESNRGESTLSRKANNHFGIKCGSSWTGKEIYRKDDDYTSTGELMQSCFRAYDSAEESFIAHSEFLRKKRYRNLFDFSTLDYRSWAEGLRLAGYATDPKYPQKLIYIIDKYELYSYDVEMNPSFIKKEQIVVQTNRSKENPVVDHAPSRSDVVIVERSRKRNKQPDHREVSPHNNDATQETATKRDKKYHIVASNETMLSIAQRYRMNIKKLYAYNRIPEGSEVVVGEEIKLNGYIHWGRKPKYVMADNYLNDSSANRQELLFVNDFHGKD